MSNNKEQKAEAGTMAAEKDKPNQGTDLTREETGRDERVEQARRQDPHFGDHADPFPPAKRWSS